jgi:hypothetical protein
MKSIENKIYYSPKKAKKYTVYTGFEKQRVKITSDKPGEHSQLQESESETVRVSPLIWSPTKTIAWA